VLPPVGWSWLTRQLYQWHRYLQHLNFNYSIPPLVWPLPPKARFQMHCDIKILLNCTLARETKSRGVSIHRGTDASQYFLLWSTNRYMHSHVYASSLIRNAFSLVLSIVICNRSWPKYGDMDAIVFIAERHGLMKGRLLYWYCYYVFNIIWRIPINL
jgi:hypothetical protein